MIQIKHNNEEKLLFYSFFGILVIISSYVMIDNNMIIRPIVYINTSQAQGSETTPWAMEKHLHT
jgi:hypothetical protein